MKVIRIALLGLAATFAIAEQRTKWEILQSAPQNATISVLQKDGRVMQGRFVAWSPTGINLVSDDTVTSIARQDVRQVTIHRRKSRWKGLAFGALLGFGIGFPIGAASAGFFLDRSKPGAALRAQVGTGIGMFSAAIAAPIGALTAGDKSTVLYRSGP